MNLASYIDTLESFNDQILEIHPKIGKKTASRLAELLTNIIGSDGDAGMADYVHTKYTAVIDFLYQTDRLKVGPWSRLYVLGEDTLLKAKTVNGGIES